MSTDLITLIYGKVCGSAMRKAVLIRMADRANDDGSGIYTSKSRIAAELECSRRTVQTTVQELEADGLLFAVGKKTGQHGYTIIYQISVQNVHLLPSAWDKCADQRTLDSGLGEDVDEPEEVRTTYALEEGQVRKSNGSSANVIRKNRPYRTIDKNAGARASANGPAADRRKASSAGPSQADFRRMAGDPEFAREHRESDDDQTPRGRLANLREELASLERTQSKYAMLSDENYTAKRDALVAVIEALEKTEH